MSQTVLIRFGVTNPHQLIPYAKWIPLPFNPSRWHYFWQITFYSSTTNLSCNLKYIFLLILVIARIFKHYSKYSLPRHLYKLSIPTLMPVSLSSIHSESEVLFLVIFLSIPYFNRGRGR